MSAHRFWLVVPAAGIGRRMQSTIPKQYLTLFDRFVLDVTLSRLLASCSWQGCVVSLNPDDSFWAQTESSSDGRIETCAGGAQRVDSVLASLRYLEGRANADDWVLVHDVARPCIHRNDLNRLRDELRDDRTGGLLAAQVSDTLKRVVPGSGCVDSTADRDQLWRAFTPQMFRYGDLLAAMEKSVRGDPGVITDEASAMELAGWKPRIVVGRTDNIKITVPEDLALAEFILARQDVK